MKGVSVANTGSAMLTTVDNPWNPFTNYDAWYAYDEQAGYHTPSLLARIAFTSDELSEADQEAAVQEAIEEIIRENVSGIHVKVYVDSDNSRGI